VSRTYDLVAGLPLRVDGYGLERLETPVTREWTRVTTVVRLSGDGVDGVGEDVTYENVDQDILQAAGGRLPLAGEHTVDGFSARLGELDLFPTPPQRAVSRRYRRWAFESAALDLALRQAGMPLTEALGRPARPVSFVVSMGLGDPPGPDRIVTWLGRDPGLRFKLDATSAWDDGLVAELAATGAVDAIDLKGLYHGTVVDQPPDARLYRLVAEGFPDAWIEDAALTPDTDEVMRPHRDRLTWDANIHGVGDVASLPFPPRMINVKPSRFGAISELLDTYDLLAARRIQAYGGGQFELGPGRGQVQYLAAMFHPDAPNDVAPGAYNLPDPPADVPRSPLPATPAPAGFRWDGG
jgi:L-alanine-DL-glutamate epimerase-like enolase superfamily enzyme